EGRLNTWDVRYTWHRLAHLDWDTIGRWHAQGFPSASNTASHQRLTWLAADQAAAELERSRETLRQRLGLEAARAVAYPFGARDERIERLANTAGYELGFGGVHGNGSRLALARAISVRSEEHTSELQSLRHLVCRLLLEKKKNPPAAPPAQRRRHRGDPGVHPR